MQHGATIAEHQRDQDRGESQTVQHAATAVAAVDTTEMLPRIGRLKASFSWRGETKESLSCNSRKARPPAAATPAASTAEISTGRFGLDGFTGAVGGSMMRNCTLSALVSISWLRRAASRRASRSS